MIVDSLIGYRDDKDNTLNQKLFKLNYPENKGLQMKNGSILIKDRSIFHSYFKETYGHLIKTYNLSEGYNIKDILLYDNILLSINIEFEKEKIIYFKRKQKISLL